ncbi:MAG: class I SAM-dependent methyltransferase [Myxococcota bacterium]
MPSWNTCPVCGSSDSRPYVAFAELEFVACTSCGSVYKSSEQPELLPDDFYEGDYFRGRKSGREKRFEHRVKKAERWLSVALESVEAKSMLDVGCSLGYVIEAGDRLKLASTGCDISEYAVEACRERGYRAEVGTMEELPFKDGEFDIVSMKHVLEHTPTPREALAEIARVSSDDAAVVIAVPDLNYWKGRWQRRRYRYFRPDDLGRQHYVYYTVDSLCRLLESCGYAVRARSKAVFRRKRAGRGPIAAVVESGRYAALAVWQGIAQTFGLRRELFVVAQRVPAKAQPAEPEQRAAAGA